MSDLVRATQMEVLKLRRTLALWASLLVPLAVIAMTTAMNLSRALGTRFDPDQPNGWESLMLDLVLFLWCLVGLPPFVALETALLAELEHRENTWKHLFALPIPRWTIYVPKVLIAFVLVCISSLVLTVGTGLEGLVLLRLRPDLGLTQPIPWGLILLRSFSFVSGDGPGGRQHDRWHHVVTFAEEHCEHAVQPTAGEHLPVVASVRGAGSPGDHRSAGDRVARWATWRCGHRSPRLLGRGPPRRGLSALRVSRRALVTDLGAASAWCWCVRSSGYGEGP